MLRLVIPVIFSVLIVVGACNDPVNQTAPGRSHSMLGPAYARGESPYGGAVADADGAEPAGGGRRR